VHRYGAAGWYDVSLNVSNAGGNSTLTKGRYIHVVSPQITLIPGNVTLIEGNTVDLALVVGPLPEGLERYNITIAFENGSIGRIDGITLPGWASPGSYAPVPAERVWIAGTDGGEEIEPGADNVTLAVITVSGVGDGVTRIIPELNELGNDDGSDFIPGIVPARLVVTDATVGLKPFPGKGLPPADLDGDGTYEDINGNGLLDFNDVITYFRYMNWIEDNQTIQYFDFNRNGWIDFNDVILLFRMV
jgi:PKD repeat protein